MGETLMEMEEIEDSRAKNDRMQFFKLLRKVTEVCDQGKITVKEIESLCLKCKDLKFQDFLDALDPLEQQKSELTTETVKNTLLTVFIKKCKESQNDLCFFNAAKCDVKELKKIIKIFDINTSRCCDSILVFTLKYGNIPEPRNGDTSEMPFFKTVDLLLKAGVDINKPDFNGKTAIDHVVILHKRESDADIRGGLETLIDKLNEKGLFRQLLEDETWDYINKLSKTSHHFLKVHQELGRRQKINQLFRWIGKKKVREFLHFEDIREFVEEDNGEYTLLQFACIKSAKMHLVVKFLLENGANPNGVTQLQPLAPLVQSARKNHKRSFETLLKHEKLEISQDIFDYFVQERAKLSASNYFQMLLESDKLHLGLTYKSSGNRPLHYAVLSGSTKSLQKVLERASKGDLFVENRAGKCPLDGISVSSLEAHLNDCIILNEEQNLDSYDSEVVLCLKTLIASGEQDGELKIISKILEKKQLHRLLNHPLIYSLIALKWGKICHYFWWWLLLQFYLYVNLSIYFCLFCQLSLHQLVMCFIFLVLNYIIKVAFFVATCNFVMEVSLFITLIGALFYGEFKIFALVQMTIILLFSTACYHPKLAKWSVFLKNIFKTCVQLVVFFSFAVLAIAAVFHLTTNMTTDFKMYKSFCFSKNGAYVVLISIVAVLAVITVTNFYVNSTASIVTNFNSLEKALKFMNLIERCFANGRVVRVLRFPNPVIFPKNEDKYEFSIYIDRKNQFKNCRCCPANVDSECLKKIKQFCYNKI